MKKNLLLASAFVMFSTAAMAQSLALGPEVGVNFAKMNFDNPSSSFDESGVVGFRAGLTARVGWGKLALEPGIFYASKGGVGETSLAGVKVAKYENKLSYLEIPVLLQYRLIKVGPAKIFIGAGPVANFALSGTTTVTDFTTATPKITEGDITFGSETGNLSSTDFGLMFNAGAEIMGFFLRPYYQMGLSNISSTSGTTLKNNCFGVSIGFLFGKK
jgi:hypothetical protein